MVVRTHFLITLTEEGIIVNIPSSPHFFSTLIRISFPNRINPIPSCLIRNIVQKLLSVSFLAQKIVFLDNYSVKLREQHLVNLLKTGM